jgi:hypothetical protein
MIVRFDPKMGKKRATPDTPQVINLANTMGKKPSGNPYLNNPKAQSKYLLPAEFNQNTRAFRKYTLSPIFERAAQSQGFNVTMKGWEQQYNKLCFICRRGRFAQLKKEEAGTSPTTTDNDYRIPLSTHRKRKKKKKGKKSKAKNTPVQRKKAVNTTGMPVKGLSEKCPFQFCVYWAPILIGGFFQPSNKGLCNIVDIFGASQNLCHCQLRLYLGMRLLWLPMRPKNL